MGLGGMGVGVGGMFTGLGAGMMSSMLPASGAITPSEVPTKVVCLSQVAQLIMAYFCATGCYF